MGAIHAARFDTSARLQRVQALMGDGVERSTREIIDGAQVCAVSACMAELRAQGAVITCRQEVDATGQRRWFYTMIAPAGAPNTELQGQTDGH